jgi:hypothetical protein
MIPYPTTIDGCLLVVHPRSNPEEDSVNEKGLVAETSDQSINRKQGKHG